MVSKKLLRRPQSVEGFYSGGSKAKYSLNRYLYKLDLPRASNLWFRTSPHVYHNHSRLGLL